MGKKSLLENSTLFLNYYLPMNAKTGKSLRRNKIFAGTQRKYLLQ